MGPQVTGSMQGEPSIPSLDSGVWSLSLRVKGNSIKWSQCDQAIYRDI
jgi:hypothetical protein